MTKTVIDRFNDGYQFLSNFYWSPVVLEDDGIEYPSVEHAYQAAKTQDASIRKKIREADTFGKAKRMGSAKKKGGILRGELPNDWDNKSLEVMENLLRQKFKKGTELGDALVSTFPAKLVEGNNWHDCKWGCCNCSKCKSVGQNQLGKILMRIRKDIMED